MRMSPQGPDEEAGVPVATGAMADLFAAAAFATFAAAGAVASAVRSFCKVRISRSPGRRRRLGDRRPSPNT